MKYEIINLINKESELSIKFDDANINDFAELIKELGKKKTDYIKSSEISNDLNTKYIGKNLYVYNELGSTNTVAKYLSQNGVANGSVVISEKQNKGRGRSGKSWESPLGGIWLSIILNPDVSISHIPFITLSTGVAVAKALEKIGVENPEIKWPNDIMINGRKVCGILTEAITHLNDIKHVIIGVGIDVNIDINDLPQELHEITTTINKELQQNVNENLLIKIFLEEFEKINGLFENKCYDEILKEWRKRSNTIGKIVEVRKPFHKHYDAYVIGISKDGSLIVEKNDGSLERIISGECVIKN